MLSSKEVKQHLRAANTHIRANKHQLAEPLVKQVLANEPANYQARVMLGVCLEAHGGVDQELAALNCYRSAATDHPDQLLAWMGLASACEKSFERERKRELRQVYSALLRLLPHSESRRADYLLRQLELMRAQGDSADAIILAEMELKTKECDVCTSSRVRHWLYSSDVYRSVGQLKALDGVLEELVKEGESCPRQATLDWLMLAVELRVSAAELRRRCRVAQHNLGHREIRTRQLLFLLNLEEAFTECKTWPTEDEDFVEIEEDVYELTSCSVAALCGIVAALTAGDWSSARERLIASSAILCTLTKLWAGVLALIFTVHYHVHDATGLKSDMEELLEKNVLFLGNKAQFICRARRQVNECLSRTETPALMTFVLQHNTEPETYESDELVALGYCQATCNKLGDALCTLDKVVVDAERNALRSYIALGQNQLDYALSAINDALAISLDNYWYLYIQGCVLWRLARRQEAKGSLLRASKADPLFANIFYRLGICYSQEKSPEAALRARKCLQRSVQLAPWFEPASLELCDLLFREGLYKDAAPILENITALAPSATCGWAWLRLGLLLLRDEDPDLNRAIEALQLALRAEPDNASILQCLGDAYQQRGSFTAALRSYRCAIEKEKEEGLVAQPYCEVQVARVLSRLGNHVEAVCQYENLLEKGFDKWAPVFYGLGESHFALAQIGVREGLFHRVKYHVEQALRHLARCLLLRSDLSCVWSLMADAAALLQRYEISADVAADIGELRTCMFSLPALLFSNDDRAKSQEQVAVSLCTVLKLAARCYCRALASSSDAQSDPALWHNLGLNLLHTWRFTRARETLDRAELCLKRATAMNPSYSQHWSALATLYTLRDECAPLAQHCFVRALTLESGGTGGTAAASQMWTNLGVLYLKVKNITLGHRAFSRAQSSNPEYGAAWVGQAIIAESVEDDQVLDLYRHSCDIAKEPEGVRGYAAWLCALLTGNTSLSSEERIFVEKRLHSVQTAVDALDQLQCWAPYDAWLCNALALLLERCGLMRSCEEQLRKAERLEMSAPLREAVLGNLSRVLIRNGQNEEALSLCKQRECFSTLSDWCTAGLAYAAMGNFPEAQVALNYAAELTKSPEHACQLLAALGVLAWRGDYKDAALEILFNEEITRVHSQPVTQMVVAVALLSGHVENFDADKKLDSPFLLACGQLLRGNKMATKLIERAIWLRPDFSTNWTHLALLRRAMFVSTFDRAAFMCAEIGATLEPITERRVASLCDIFMEASLDDSLNKSERYLARRRILSWRHCFPHLQQRYIT